MLLCGSDITLYSKILVGQHFLKEDKRLGKGRLVRKLYEELSIHLSRRRLCLLHRSELFLSSLGLDFYGKIQWPNKKL